MMPSRGLQLARGQAARFQNIQRRNLSSASSRIPSTRILSPSTIASSGLRSWRSRAPLAISAVPAIRFASTLPTASSPPPPVAPTTPESSGVSHLDTINLDNIDLESTSHVVEKIGFLNELGLDWGYGMTSTLQYVLEHLHLSAGLPWWGSIIATGVLMRLAMFPLVRKSSDVTARQGAMAPVLGPMMEEMNAAKKAGDNERMALAYKKMSITRKQAGISIPSQLSPMLFQAWIGYCGYRLMRGMATLPVPGLDEGGFLWLTDLTVSDPFLILPAAMGLSIHFLTRLGGESGAANTDVMGDSTKKIMLYGLPVFITAVTAWQPAAVGLWFASTGAIGICQSLLLKQPGVRNFLNIAPLYKPPRKDAMAARGLSQKSTDETTSWLANKFTSQATARASKPDPTPKRPTGPVYQAPNIRTRSSKFKGKTIDVAAKRRD